MKFGIARILSGWKLNLLLFLLTILTTWAVGGAAYCAALVGILLCHEMGHYLTARYYRVKASLPYFIPVPFAFGTFGAVIKMDETVPDRRALTAIGAMGPIAGMAAAVPLLFYGLSISMVGPETGGMPELMDYGLMGIIQNIFSNDAEIRIALFFIEGNSLLYWTAKNLLFDIPPNHDVWIHPVAFAAWIGLFVTALNMIPVGQLDGGHVSYGLWGKKAAKLNNIIRGILLGLGLTLWMGWLIWVVLISFILRAGGSRLPVLNPEIKPGSGTKVLAFLAILSLIITFSPAPLREIRISREEALNLPEEIKSYANICDEWIEWRYDLERLPFRKKIRAGPPPVCDDPSY